MNFDRHRQLRKVAVLVASLEESLARPLLDELSPRDADEVRSMIAQLGNVDIEEQQDILSEFHRRATLSKQSPTNGVQMDASLREKIHKVPVEHKISVQDEADFNSELPIAARHAWLVEAEASTIAELLGDEHPQTVAVVIFRLPANLASEVIGLLSPTLQAEVLSRLAQLDTTDEQAIDVVESQLNDRISQRRQRQQRMAAGLEVVNDILKHTPTDQQEALLANLRRHNPSLAGRITKPNTTNSTIPKATRSRSPRFAVPSHVTNQATSLEAAIADARSTAGYPPASSSNEKPVGQPVPSTAPEVEQQLGSSNPLKELEQFDEGSILVAIGRTDHRVVSLALAGANDRLIKRLLRRLPRRQARLFRSQLQISGPTSLRDMLAAQQEFVAMVRRISQQTQSSTA